ncbi:hypothetical protein K1X76_05565 [bacterium]|nr:hypothetical protein [bacterium]
MSTGPFSNPGSSEPGAEEPPALPEQPPQPVPNKEKPNRIVRRIFLWMEKSISRYPL